MSPESVRQLGRLVAPALDTLKNTLTNAVPRGRVQVWVRESESFPYTATVGVSESDPAGDEVAVVTVSLWTDGQVVRGTLDLVDGEGMVLVEGQTLDSVEPVDETALLAWGRDAIAFLGCVAADAVTLCRQRGL